MTDETRPGDAVPHVPAWRRMAWTGLCVVAAVFALWAPRAAFVGRADAEFVSTLVEVRQRIDRRYVREVEPAELIEDALRGMLFRLDPYTAYYPPDLSQALDDAVGGQFRGVGILVEPPLDGEAASGPRVVITFPESPAAAAGVLPGDRIVGVDGDDITDLPLEAVTRRILGQEGTPVTLTLARGPGPAAERVDKTMNRAVIRQPVLEGYARDPSPDADQGFRWFMDATAPIPVAYVRFGQFTEGSVGLLRQRLQRLLDEGARGVILDLRGNGGGLLTGAIEMADLFLDSGLVVTSEGTNSPRRRYFASPAGTLPDFPLVLLVDDATASAAEIVAGALQEHGRAVVVGSRTFGKGSVQDLIPLRNGGRLRLTTSHYYLPSGRLLHRESDSTVWGVEPDVDAPRASPGGRHDPYAGPPSPEQVRVAYEVMLGLLAREARPAG